MGGPPGGDAGPGGVTAQLDLALFGVVVDALGRLATVNVVLEFLTVRRLVGRPVLDLLRLYRDLVGEAGAQPATTRNKKETQFVGKCIELSSTIINRKASLRTSSMF